MPDEIAPVFAPFPTIDFKKPQFPSETVTVSLSTSGINTAAIQQAIDELSARGGGTVRIPAGEWFTGRIILKDNINLNLEDGAALRFSGEIKDYQPAVFTRYEGVEVMSLGGCIYANNATNIAVTGKGRLIGPGKSSAVHKQVRSDTIDNYIDWDSPVSERVYDGVNSEHIFPPMFISPIQCEGVYIEGISLENTAFWNIVPVYCDNVIVRGVTIHSVGIPRGDGINVDSTRNALIEYCTLSCGDDCFTMKAGRGPDGIRVNKPTENIVVRYCLTLAGHGGVTCGSETAGWIRNLYVHDCVFTKTRVGIRFKTRRPRGGGGDTLYYEGIRLSLGGGDAFNWDMLGSRRYVGNLADRLPARDINELTPGYKNIHANAILVENAGYLVKVIGIPESPLANFTIDNVKINCSKLFRAQDLVDSRFSDIEVTTDDSTISLLDAKNLLFENIDSRISGNISLDIEGPASENIEFRSCTNIDDGVYP